MKPYNLPYLPIQFDAETELSFYKLTVDASTALEKVRQKLNYSIVNKSFIQLVALNESVQSTKIEGSQVTFSEMLESELSEDDNWKTKEIENYRKALYIGAERIQHGYPITQRLIKELHDILMEDARGATSASGQYRKIQNFIGPTKKMEDAQYIPSEPQKMAEYMSNLEFYINGNPYDEKREDTHPLIKSAIIHAQFESIHPFLDGNGRLGRILIILYLMQEKLMNEPVFFLSEELEKERFKYYALLNGVRAIKGEETDWKSWIEFFLSSIIRMAQNQFKKLDEAERLYQRGLSHIEQPSIEVIWAAFFMHPITTVKDLQKMTELAPSTIRKGLKVLEEKRLIFGNDYRRNRRYYLYDLIRIMEG